MENGPNGNWGEDIRVSYGWGGSTESSGARIKDLGEPPQHIKKGNTRLVYRTFRDEIMDSVTTLINESKTEVDGPTFVECPFLIHKK